MGCCSSSTTRDVGDEFTNLLNMYHVEGGKPAKQAAGQWHFRAPTADYVQHASDSVPSTVIIFSGCKDSQTSADVGDVTSFGLPVVSEAQKAGGACTNGLLSVLKSNPDISYGDLLIKMQSVLRQRRYEQIPQLSASHQMDLRQKKFSPMNPNAGSGRTRALLVGINYTGQRGQLNGCINDVRMMERFLLTQGYSSNSNDMRILTDDPSYGVGLPTNRNILEGLRWLTAGAKAGDSLFVHYSGHGTSIPDKDSDEVDKMDEAVVPLDYQHGGLITDDTLFQVLVATLPTGVQLVGVFDCCHSGTIVDLPFIFSATDEAVQNLSSGSTEAMGENPSFNFNFAEMLTELAQSGKLLSAIKLARSGAPPSEILSSLLSSAVPQQ